MQQVTKRLKPKQEIRAELEKIIKDNNIKSGVLLSVVGGVVACSLRMPDGKTVKTWNEPMEIVSGTGTLSQDGVYIHLSFSNMNGDTMGGHLKKAVVKETTEIVVLTFNDATYKREPDEETGYDELKVE
ncbi:MAG: DUF296 domain-containing protein [Candidatus Spechtbacterales bacterium]|nr:DUF296 domain-containing protein [Candidatus Spechtbacterales bacterium]